MSLEYEPASEPLKQILQMDIVGFTLSMSISAEQLIDLNTKPHTSRSSALKSGTSESNTAALSFGSVTPHLKNELIDLNTKPRTFNTKLHTSKLNPTAQY